MSYPFMPPSCLEETLEKHSVTRGDYSKVLERLKKLGYKNNLLEDQTKKMIGLAKIGDRSLYVIDALAETGYYLDTLEKNESLMNRDYELIKGISATGLEKYLDTFNNVKKILGYKGKKKHFAATATTIHELSKLEGDALGALDSLVKSGYKIQLFSDKYRVDVPMELVKKLAKTNNKEYMNVFTKLKEKLGYKTIAGDGYNQVDAIIRLSKVNNVCNIIDVLGATGYYLGYSARKTIENIDLDTIEDIANLGVGTYWKRYHDLKNTLKVSRVNSFIVDRIVQLSKMGDKAFEILDTLAKTGYTFEKLAGFRWINTNDVELVNNLMRKGLETYLEGLDKVKDFLGYKSERIPLEGYGQSIEMGRGSKIKYRAGHANDIISLLEMEDSCWQAISTLAKTGYEFNFSGNRIFKNKDALHLVESLAGSDRKKYLEVFTALNNNLNYKTVNVGEYVDTQVERILSLSKIEGAAQAIIALAQTGYKLDKLGKKEWLSYNDTGILEKIAKCGADNYLKTFKSLKKHLGYKTVHNPSSSMLSPNSGSYDQIEKVIEISKIGNTCEAIESFSKWNNLSVNAFGKDNSLHAGSLWIDGKKVDKLPPWGNFDISHDFKKYKIDKKKGITAKDVAILAYISDQLWKEYVEGAKYLEILSPCFYACDNPEKFIECFNSLTVNDKKRIIRAIFKCSKASNEKIIKWLDNNEASLVREVGLE